MKGKELILALCIAVLLLVGCQKTAEQPTQDNFHSGIKGIDVIFTKGFPPRVFTGSELTFGLELENKGAFPPTYSDYWGDYVKPFSAKLVLSGYDQSIIQLSPYPYIIDIPSDALPGRSVYFPDGGRYLISDVKATTVQLPQGTDKMPNVPILVQLCYQYETLANPVICYDPDPFNVNIKSKACTMPTSYTLSGGQGGPIAITRLEQNKIPNGMLFKFYIKNMGNGLAIDVDEYSRCPNELQLNDLGKLSINARLSNGIQLECGPSNYVILPEKTEGYITCKTNQEVCTEACKTPLRIQLSYVYMTSVQKNIEVVRVPQ